METEEGPLVGRSCWSQGCWLSGWGWESSASPLLSSGGSGVPGTLATCASTNMEMEVITQRHHHSPTPRAGRLTGTRHVTPLSPCLHHRD